MSNTKSELDQIVFALPHRPSPKVAPIIFGESLTEQSHKQSCDINNIITSETDGEEELLFKTWNSSQCMMKYS